MVGAIGRRMGEGSKGERGKLRRPSCDALSRVGEVEKVKGSLVSNAATRGCLSDLSECRIVRPWGQLSQLWTDVSRHLATCLSDVRSAIDDIPGHYGARMPVPKRNRQHTRDHH